MRGQQTTIFRRTSSISPFVTSLLFRQLSTDQLSGKQAKENKTRDYKPIRTAIPSHNIAWVFIITKNVPQIKSVELNPLLFSFEEVKREVRGGVRPGSVDHLNPIVLPISIKAQPRMEITLRKRVLKSPKKGLVGRKSAQQSSSIHTHHTMFDLQTTINFRMRAFLLLRHAFLLSSRRERIFQTLFSISEA